MGYMTIMTIALFLVTSCYGGSSNYSKQNEHYSYRDGCFAEPNGCYPSQYIEQYPTQNTLRYSGSTQYKQPDSTQNTDRSYRPKTFYNWKTEKVETYSPAYTYPKGGYRNYQTGETYRPIISPGDNTYMNTKGETITIYGD